MTTSSGTPDYSGALGTTSRRSFTLGGLGIAAAYALSACGDDSANDAAVNSDGSVDLSKVTLVIGDQKGTSAQQMISASGLDKTPYKIEWKEFTSGPPILEALNAGSVAIGQVGNTPPIFAAAASGKFKVVQAVSYTGTGDVILVPKGSSLTSVADLKGKNVAVAQGSSANYNLLAQLQKAGVDYGDIEVQNLQPADALAAFTAGHLDAWAVWDPYTSQAVVTYGAQVLASGDGVVNGVGVHVASDKALGDKASSAALSDYVARITKAQVWASENPDEWSKIWAQQTGFDPSITAAAAAERPLTVLPIGKALVSSETAMADTFAENKLIPGKVELTDYFDDRYASSIERAAGSTYDASWSGA